MKFRCFNQITGCYFLDAPVQKGHDIHVCELKENQIIIHKNLCQELVEIHIVSRGLMSRIRPNS